MTCPRSHSGLGAEPALEGRTVRSQTPLPSLLFGRTWLRRGPGPVPFPAAKPGVAQPTGLASPPPLRSVVRSSLKSSSDPDLPNWFPPDVKGNVLEGTGCVFLQNHLSHKMICILVGTQMPLPAHFLPREKCSHHSFPLKGGGSCVGPVPTPGEHFLMGGVRR